MEVHKRVAKGVTICSLSGELDARTAQQVQDEILMSMPKGVRILLNFADVTFVSSAGLRTMLLIYRQAQRVQGSVALVGLSEELKSVLSATGFLGFFVVAGTVEEGLAALRATAPERSGT